MYEANDQLKGKGQKDTAKTGGSGQEHNYDLDLILDIPLDISVELGKVKMPVNELLRLGPGSIIELAKSVGEPLDIYVNNKLVAKGEVVILDEKFGVRVADIINPIERVKSLSK
ncbi:MAG: flagellar motor switch protein FliN [Pseudomonadota bacterium]|uniref:Flagellar motor switch protein FliN n=1 Tax=Candidatus Desulfatibia profunda TaxID=2841695 RepID=A0A8J6NVJ8_9BACT|nr:flagellar motor switch protein FliN [Candidatus Desulfatibia profunda]MBL7179774.1 flagellar motor switch protein FliN [Desulfobacterales bacterium]